MSNELKKLLIDIRVSKLRASKEDNDAVVKKLLRKRKNL